MPVCKLVSVDYLNRTGKQGALIGILFIYAIMIFNLWVVRDETASLLLIKGVPLI